MSLPTFASVCGHAGRCEDVHPREFTANEIIELSWVDHAIERGRAMAVQQLFTKVSKLEMEDGTFIGFRNTTVRQAWDKLQAHEKSEKAKSKTTHLWITINPDITRVDLDTFVKRCAKAHTKKWIKEYTYAIENFTESGQHFHCHSIVNKCKRSGGGGLEAAKREFYNTFWQFFPPTNGVEPDPRYNTQAYKSCPQIHIKPITAVQKDVKLNYIKGIKRNPAKRNLVDKDRIWRRDHNIKQLYSNAVLSQEDLHSPLQQQSDPHSEDIRQPVVSQDAEEIHQ